MNELFIILSMLALSAFFSGMEIAFVAANKLRMELDKSKNTVTSRIINVFTNHPGHYISTMLVGNNIALVIYGIMMAKILEPTIALWVESELLIMTIQTIFSTLLILFTAEFLPKTLFRLNPNLSLNLFAVPVMFFYVIFYPVTVVTMMFSKNIISRILRTEISDEVASHAFGKVDLDHLVQEGQEAQSVLEEDEHNMKLFRNALDFSNVKLRECFVPRTEIEAMDISGEIEDLTQRFIETGYSRIMIYKESIDNIIGYVHSSVLFRKPQSIKAALSRVIIVPETMAAHKLLNLFTREQKSVAVVVDEFGGTSGMVTIEDIMEEIFGEIEDEHDSVDLVEEQLSETEFIFSGRIEIDYLNDKYKLELPVSDDFETLNGFIIFNHGSIPNSNEIIRIKEFRIQIVEVSKTRINKVKLTLLS
ncbi:CBS domain containing-hemolysin-like protein [Ancylomarina subtilis]|uniref:CBS domain containing-hemolysin-like protein n=1 Tax=Ancylomarina subtilis TaxID=1639035 RepID=A0A4Q7V9H3_9BACT|nr:hemolysin family protein [Ancylomarina subtilis]RZT91278.1 CBS domain containing-hemolysin-like protein [Ancylomarina subtilis]